MYGVIVSCFTHISWILVVHHRYTPEIPEPAPSLFRHGAQIGSLLSFSCNQKNRGSSDAYATCIYHGPRVKINMCKMLHGVQRSWAHFFWVCFCVCGHQKTRRPPIWAPWLTTPLHGVVWRSGISRVYLCCTCTQKASNDWTEILIFNFFYLHIWEISNVVYKKNLSGLYCITPGQAFITRACWLQRIASSFLGVLQETLLISQM